MSAYVEEEEQSFKLTMYTVVQCHLGVSWMWTSGAQSRSFATVGQWACPTGTSYLSPFETFVLCRLIGSTST